MGRVVQCNNNYSGAKEDVEGGFSSISDDQVREGIRWALCPVCAKEQRGRQAVGQCCVSTDAETRKTLDGSLRGAATEGVLLQYRLWWRAVWNKGCNKVPGPGWAASWKQQAQLRAVQCSAGRRASAQPAVRLVQAGSQHLETSDACSVEEAGEGQGPHKA